MVETEKIFVNNSTPTIQEEVITLRIENEQLKKDNKICEEIIIGEQQEINKLEKENAKLKKCLSKYYCLHNEPENFSEYFVTKLKEETFPLIKDYKG